MTATATKTTTNAPKTHVVPVLTKTQLVNMLVNLPKGNNFVTIIARTVPAMNKTGNPFYDSAIKDFNIRKIAEVNGAIQFNYEAAVNRQLVREGQEADFTAQAPTWGNRVGSSCVIEHKEQYYFYVKVEKSLGYAYVNLQGLPLDTKEVNKWLKSRKPSDTQGTDKEIMVRKYAIANLVAITINGMKYTII